MRNVLDSTTQVAHYWANKIQTSGRSGNVSFVDSSLFSYKALIAKHMPEGVVVLATRNWSATTGRHQAEARSASSHLIQIFVDDIVPVPQAFEQAQRQVKALLEFAVKARERRPVHLANAVTVAKNFNRYSAVMGSDLRLSEVVEVTPEVLAQIKQESAEALQRRKVRELEAVKAQAQRQLDGLAALQLWRSGETVYKSLYAMPVALRVKGELIQTSHGASIPAEQAPALWALVKRCRSSGKAFEKPQMVGVYRLTRIEPDGAMVVGCHNIAYEEVEGIASVLGLK